MNFLNTIVSLLLLFVTYGNCALAAEELGGQGFPRLGMWWPDPEIQKLSKIARYDFITLFDYQTEYVSPLKTQNPQLTILNSTNACELSYLDDDSKIDEIPAEWFLTQVGSTLSTDIDATTTTIRVENLSVTDGNKTFSLFEPGDMALIEGESLQILAVDVASKTLTVERGDIDVRPASTHRAGTRIASHISFWPNSWLLNLSTLSPTAVVNSAIGAERWGDYNARIGADLVTANPAWDGLLIDRADPDQSWLVDGPYARTIDPDQSNTLITDYSVFNQSWNTGLRNYQSKIRELLDSDKIIFTNWGIENYPIINGNNYEAFPLDDGSSYRGSWHDTVFGSISNIGSYTQWMEQGLQPNLTMIETYEDDGIPENGDLSYANRCTRADFVPNYRKMRFGLTTALLNNGYFSWEMNTNGHGSLCLKWFDEYDNVGQGRGYLGQPLGAAYQPAGLSIGTNQLTGGTFENQGELDLWGFDTDSGNIATVSLDTGETPSGNASARVNITKASGTDWHIALAYMPLTLESNKEYTLSFWAKADRQRPVSLWAQLSQSPWTDFLENHQKEVSTQWQKYEYTVKTQDGNTQGEFKIGFGQTTGTVWIDDVRLQKGGRDVWRRDFTGGSVIVNATQNAKTINLGQTLRKIKGVQAPAVNDGSLVTQVTIPSLDGLILLSETSMECDTAMRLNLPSNQWRQISLPCQLPNNARTVQAVFADDLEGTYGEDWVVFSFDSVANTYTDVGLNGLLTQEMGYWVIQTNGVTAVLDLPVGSTQAVTVPSNLCAGTEECYRIPLTSNAERVQWNMLGYPFSKQSAVDRWKIVTNSGVCNNGCTLEQAKVNNIVESELWHYTGSEYELLQGSVSPWSGFWVAVYAGAETLEPTLEISTN